MKRGKSNGREREREREKEYRDLIVGLSASVRAGFPVSSARAGLHSPRS